MTIPFIKRAYFYVILLSLVCAPLYAQIKEDRYGNKYYYDKIDKNINNLRVLFVSDPHGNTYKISQLVGYKNDIEKKHPEDATLLLWGGDEPKGYPIWGFRKNEIGYSLWAKHAYAAVIGNHDLIYYPLDNIDRLIEKKGLQFIATNISSVNNKDTKKKVYPYPRYKIVELADGKKILILGMVTQSINTDDRISNKIYMETPSSEYNKILTQVETIYGTISKVFLLAHFERRLSPEKGEDLETFVNKIENKNVLVFKGHDHKDGTYFLKVEGALIPVIETGESLNLIKYVKMSAQDLEYKGHLDIDVRGLSPDKQTNIFINNMKNNIPIPLKYDVLSEYLFDGSDHSWHFNRAEIDARPEDPGEIILNTSVTALVLDAYRYVVNSNMAMLESGNVRSGIPKKKNVTGMDIYKVIPFENDIVVSEVLGARIEEIINENYKSGEQRILIRGVVQVYDEINDRLVIKKVYDPSIKDYKIFDPKLTYTISSIDHFAKKHSLNIIDENTGWKDYLAIISYIRAKNKIYRDKSWIAKYHEDYYLCNVSRNGNKDITRSSYDVNDPIFDKVKIDSDKYYRTYTKMSIEQMTEELDVIIPELKKLNNGYLFGLTPADDAKDAKDLLSSIVNIYNVWGNLFPHERNLKVIYDIHGTNTDAAYNDWMLRLRAFILLSRLFRELYPENPRTADVWGHYVDLRIKSDEFVSKRSKKKNKSINKNTINIVSTHQGIKDEAKKEIADILKGYSKVGFKLPIDLYEKVTNYNNQLIDLIKELCEKEGVKYHTEILSTSYGKYTAIVYETEGDHYINRIAKFRSRFKVKLVYLPVIFILTEAGAQYDSKGVFYVGDNFAKMLGDYKNLIHEDIHILFKSMWNIGMESDFHGSIYRNVKLNILEPLYSSEVSIDEVPAYIETISYELRAAVREEDPLQNLVYAKKYLKVVTDITDRIIVELEELSHLLNEPYEEFVLGIEYDNHDYYKSKFFFNKNSLTVKTEVKKGPNNTRYTDIIFEKSGFNYNTMTKAMIPEVDFIRTKINRQLELMKTFSNGFHELDDNVSSVINNIGLSKEVDKYKTGLLVKEVESIRAIYRQNISVNEGVSFKDAIKAYNPNSLNNTSSRVEENNSNLNISMPITDNESAINLLSFGEKYFSGVLYKTPAGIHQFVIGDVLISASKLFNKFATQGSVELWSGKGFSVDGKIVWIDESYPGYNVQDRNKAGVLIGNLKEFLDSKDGLEIKDNYFNPDTKFFTFEDDNEYDAQKVSSINYLKRAYHLDDIQTISLTLNAIDETQVVTKESQMLLGAAAKKIISVYKGYTGLQIDNEPSLTSYIDNLLAGEVQVSTPESFINEYNGRINSYKKHLITLKTSTNEDLSKTLVINANTSTNTIDPVSRKTSSISNFNDLVLPQDFVPLSDQEAMKILSTNTGLGSNNLMEHLEVLMERWSEQDGVLTESDKDLLFGRYGKKGIYDFIYRQVLEGGEQITEDVKFFLILSGSVAWHNQSLTGSSFGKLNIASMDLITDSFISFGILGQNVIGNSLISENINKRTYLTNNKYFVEFLNTGLNATKNYYKAVIKK